MLLKKILARTYQFDHIRKARKLSAAFYHGIETFFFNDIFVLLGCSESFFE